MFLRKTHVTPPTRSSVRAVEGRQRTRYDRFETEAFIRVRRTCTHIYKHMYGCDSFTPDSRQAPVALTFDQQTQKTVEFFFSIGAITIFTFKALGQTELKLLAIYGFYFSWPCALALLPTDPKINRRPLLNKDVHYMKFEGSGWKRTNLFVTLNVYTLINLSCTSTRRLHM